MALGVTLTLPEKDHLTMKKVQLLDTMELMQGNGPVAQLYRAFDYGSKGCGLESRRGH